MRFTRQRSRLDHSIASMECGEPINPVQSTQGHDSPVLAMTSTGSTDAWAQTLRLATSSTS